MSKVIGLLQKMVLYFLREFPELRNDDVDLQIAIIQYKYSHWVYKDQNGTTWVAVPGLKTFKEDNVKRVRAKLQNEDGLYLPTDPLVRKARGVKELEWLRWVRSQEKPVRYWNDTEKDD